MKRTLALLLLGATPVAADQIFLKGGGQLTGVVVDRTATSVVIDVAPGRLTIPASRVERIALGSSALATFQSRAASMAAGDAAGWVELGDWALERGLQTQARTAFQRAAAIDPDNAAAHRALGESLVDGRWLSEADAYRARGYVQFDGQWMTRSERDVEIQAREAESAASAARAEADARVREAEARARAAEADASRAQTPPQDPYADTWGGIPYSWVLAGGGCAYGCGYGYGHGYGNGYGHGNGHGYGTGQNGWHGSQGPVVTPPMVPPPPPRRTPAPPVAPAPPPKPAPVHVPKPH